MRKLSFMPSCMVAILVLAGLTVSSVIAAEPASTRYTKGYAYDLKSDELLYTEAHEERYDGETLRSSVVTYQSADGKIIASKKIDFSADRFLPDFQLDDARNRYVEGGRKEANEMVLFVRTGANDALKEQRSAIPTPAVADAGFNLFIKDHWDQLLSGEAVNFNFAVPSRRTYYRFQARKIEGSEFNGRPAAVIKIGMANALIGLFADPIIVTYDLETRNLMEYRGMSNIRDANGSNYDARITYSLDDIATASPR